MKFKKYLIIFCLFLGCAHFSDVEKDRQMVFSSLKDNGYSNYQITGYTIFSCDSDFGMGFKATKNDFHKSGVVCCKNNQCIIIENKYSKW